jgi:hypothetical protein
MFICWPQHAACAGVWRCLVDEQSSTRLVCQTTT